MTNLELVQEMYRAFADKNNERILEIFHPDIVWIQNEGFPQGGRHRGAETVMRDVFGNFRADWSEWKADVAEWLDAGDTIVALGRYKGTHASTGKSMRADFAHVYRVRGGRIVQFEQFTDTLMVASAME